MRSQVPVPDPHWKPLHVADQPNATEVTLAAFMESLRGEQLERLKGVLSPEQLAVMFSLYEAAQKTAEHARSNGAKTNRTSTS